MCLFQRRNPVRCWVFLRTELPAPLMNVRSLGYGPGERMLTVRTAVDGPWDLAARGAGLPASDMTGSCAYYCSTVNGSEVLGEVAGACDALRTRVARCTLTETLTETVTPSDTPTFTRTMTTTRTLTPTPEPTATSTFTATNTQSSTPTASATMTIARHLRQPFRRPHTWLIGCWFHTC